METKRKSVGGRRDATTFDFASQMFVFKLLDMPAEKTLGVVLTKEVTIMKIIRIGRKFLGGGRPKGFEVRHLSSNQPLVGFSGHVQYVFARAGGFGEGHDSHPIFRFVHHLSQDEKGEVDVDVLVS